MPATSRENASEPAETRKDDVLDVVIARVGSELASSFQALLSRLPGAPHRPQELARELRINKDLSSRILKATESRDPIATTHLMPGPEPLRRLIRAAARRNVNGEAVRSAEQSVRRFEQLIRNVAGDRSGLDTIISAWLPQVREKAELLSKQAVFKGMSQIKGAAADVDFITRFVHPAADGDGYDYVLLSGSLGLRRLRPGTMLTVNSFPMHGPTDSRRMLTLEGKAATGQQDVMLDAFCSSPLPRFEIRREGDVTCMTLCGEEVGLRSAADLAWAHVHRSCRIRSVFSTVNMPARLGVCDLMLHPSIAADMQQALPKLEIYDTTERGIAQFGDASRRSDLLDIKADVQHLGQGVSHFRCAEIPRYIEMIEHVCAAMNWDATCLHGYRCAIDYPVYGSQVILSFGG